MAAKTRGPFRFIRRADRTIQVTYRAGNGTVEVIDRIELTDPDHPDLTGHTLDEYADWWLETDDERDQP